MIKVEHLCRRYGAFTAVDGVSFSIPEGEVVGLLGPNGAGKTTTLRMITGSLRPSSGTIELNGRDQATAPPAARRQIGYLPENVAIYPEMRVDEYLRFRAKLYGMDRAGQSAAIDLALQRCLLSEVSRQIVGTLSKGYRQRVGLAAAILHGPKMLILDEPTVGLDPKQIIAIRQLIRELGSDQTLLVSTHILPEVELLCDRVLIFDRGRLTAEGSPESLRAEWSGASRLQVELKAPTEGAAALFESLPQVESVEVLGDSGRRYALRCRAGADAREAVFASCVEHHWTLLELAPERASLEEIFVRLTTEEDGQLAGAAQAEVGR